MLVHARSGGQHDSWEAEEVSKLIAARHDADKARRYWELREKNARDSVPAEQQRRAREAAVDGLYRRCVDRSGRRRSTTLSR